MIRGLLNLAALVVSTVVLGCAAIVVGGLTGRRTVVMRLGKVWSKLHLGLSGVRARYVGLENASGRTPRIFLANHFSVVDIWVLAVVLPVTTRFVAKRSLFWLPVLGQAMAVAGFIPIDRKDRRRAIRTLQAAEEPIRRGASLILFPEGTRSRDGRLAPFKKGAFHLALAAGVPIVPVAISGSGRVQRPRSIAMRPAPVRVTFFPPIDTTAYGPEDLEALILDVRASIASGLTPDELEAAERLRETRPPGSAHADSERLENQARPSP